MPLTIPPFNQYQQPIVPLRGLWNVKPAEGDHFANVEIDWMVTTTERAVQILFSANSPVAFSQIVALSVDNRRSGFDVDFVFPDSNFTLTVPAYNQGVYPVFSNALMFYVIASPGIVPGNVTVFQVLNSMPPPVSLNPTALQTSEAIGNVPINDGTTQIVPAGVNGTLTGLNVTLNFGASESATLELIDGAGNVLWVDATAGVQGQSQVINITGLNLRFTNGIQLVISGTTASNVASVNVNLFFRTP